MADRVQHVGLNPKRIARLAGPDAHASRGRDGFAGGPVGDDHAGRIGIGSLDPCDSPQYKSLPALRVAIVEGQTIREIFDGIAVEIDLEFVHSLWVVARSRDVARDGMTDVDHEDGACFTTEDIEVRDVKADVLAGDR